MRRGDFGEIIHYSRLHLICYYPKDPAPHRAESVKITASGVIRPSIPAPRYFVLQGRDIEVVVAYTAQFSENYRLKIERRADGEYAIQIQGPIPIREHREQIFHLDDAKQTAYYLALWHFQQQRISEEPIPVERVEWSKTDS